MNQQSDRHLKKFAAIFLIFLSAAVTGFGAMTNLTLHIVGDGTVSSITNGQLLTISNKYSMTAKAKDGFTFMGWTGSQTNSKAKLTFTMAAGMNFTATFEDKEKPTLSMTAPPGSKALTSDAVIVTGTARDNAAVASVFYQLNGTGWQTASTGNGWSNWWATVPLKANTNTLEAYAVDTSGNISKTNKVKMTLVAVPPSLAGMTLAATPDGDNFSLRSFGTDTFSEVFGDDMAVGSYTFKKAGAATAKLSLKYTAPPMAGNPTNDTTLLLQFTSNTNGSYGNDTINFTLATAEDWAPPTLAGSSVVLLSDGGNETALGFPQESLIVDNGHMFNVANPLVISLSAPYAGQIGDRVSVPFIQLKNISGQFQQVGTPVFVGTVIDIETNTNTVTILFDKPTFVSKTELFAPVTGSPVNILTFDYTNSLDDTTGTGTFTFTNYSPVGSLLQLNQSGDDNFLVLTFTNNSFQGNYYEESFNTASNTPAMDTGSFLLILPPQITMQPTNFTTTNGGSASFTVTAVGSPTLIYQWQMNGTNLADGDTDWGSTISNSAAANLMLFNVSTNDAGNYQVVVTNNFGSVTSGIVTLRIASTNSSPPGS